MTKGPFPGGKETGSFSSQQESKIWHSLDLITKDLPGCGRIYSGIKADVIIRGLHFILQSSSLSFYFQHALMMTKL
jgi:hypothetical protein